MPDVRLSWATKFRHVPPADFQAAQVRHKQDKREGDELDERPAKRQRSRRKYTAEDFQTPFATPNEVKEWFEKYPALQKRNFYVVQNHYATADHFDLRLHLDGETISWAIPKTLANPAALTERQAIETRPHKISYTLLEGAVASGMSTTGVWDIGTYMVCETKSKTKKRKAAMASGLDDHETTDEEHAFLQPEDERQEDAFRDAFYYITFQATPAVNGRAGQPAKKDTGKSRGIVIELNGERYRGLRLTFRRPSNDVKLKRNTRSSAKPGAQQEILRLYLINLSVAPGRSLAQAEVSRRHLDPDRSLLTSRTMQEIREDCLRWLASLAGVGDDGDGEGADEEDASTASAEEMRLGKAPNRLLNSDNLRHMGGRLSRREGRELARQLQKLLEEDDENEVEVLTRGDGGEVELLKDRAADIQINGFRY
ncbi:hypothetical protein JCM11251_000093 [Rhodosporidiobolus azoricus]